MNQKLLICLAFSANDAPLAERGLDFIYRLHGKRAIGHVLLVSNSDCHAEMRRKIAVTAELAFESVTEAVAPVIDAKLANSKFHQLNNLFRHAAKTAQDQCRWPWFWLEPDCVPVSPDWISRLADAYDSQPKKYMGLIAKGKDDKKFMARCGVYYGAAFYELDKLCQSDVPFPLATSGKVIPSAATTDLIDYLNIETPEDLGKISKSAVVVHGDKMGLFAENWGEIQNRVKELCIGSPNPEDFTKSYLLGEDSEFVKAAMNHQEIAKEIGEFLQKEAVTDKDPKKQLNAILGDIKETCSTKAYVKHLLENPTPEEARAMADAPRLTRRQKRELEQSSKLDCVATNGCKSSTETATP